jgi:hypothetical protein
MSTSFLILSFKLESVEKFPTISANASNSLSIS